MSDSPADVVDRQIAAYNDHDVDAFVAEFDEDAVVSGLGEAEPMAVGREEVRELYGGQFEAVSPTVEILSRMTLGEFVVDHERVERDESDAAEAIGVYRVRDGVIDRLWLAHE
ncbi:MAG: nuclear transport factor 2 family protein [Halobacterium sp.]